MIQTSCISLYYSYSIVCCLNQANERRIENSCIHASWNLNLEMKLHISISILFITIFHCLCLNQSGEWRVENSCIHEFKFGNRAIYVQQNSFNACENITIIYFCPIFSDSRIIIKRIWLIIFCKKDQKTFIYKFIYCVIKVNNNYFSIYK